MTWPCQAKTEPGQTLVVKRQVSQTSLATSSQKSDAVKKIEKKKNEDGTAAPTTPRELLEKAKEATAKLPQEVEIAGEKPELAPMIPKPPNHPPQHRPPHDPPPEHPTPRQREPMHNVGNLVCIWLI